MPSALNRSTCLCLAGLEGVQRVLLPRAPPYSRPPSILRGTRLGDLPVPQPTKFKLEINAGTIKALGPRHFTINLFAVPSEVVFNWL
jgi:hypothetical protein